MKPIEVYIDTEEKIVKETKDRLEKEFSKIDDLERQLGKLKCYVSSKMQDVGFNEDLLQLLKELKDYREAYKELKRHLVKKEEIAYHTSEYRVSPDVEHVHGVQMVVRETDLDRWPLIEESQELLESNPNVIFTTEHKIINPSTGKKNYLYIYWTKAYRKKR